MAQFPVHLVTALALVASASADAPRVLLEDFYMAT